MRGEIGVGSSLRHHLSEEGLTVHRNFGHILESRKKEGKGERDRDGREEDTKERCKWEKGKRRTFSRP